MLKGGVPAGFQESETLKVLGADEIHIIASLNEGNASGRAWGCDLTYEYIKINGEYRS